MNTLEADVAAFIEGEPDDEAFGRLAMRVFEHQYDRIEVVRRLADRSGRPPKRVTRWQDIPAVPTSGFKDFELFAGNPRRAARVFESSGTGGARSRSFFSDTGLELMDVAIRRNAEQLFLNDGRATRLLVLAPPPDLAPSMIMAHGMARLIEGFGVEGSRFVIGLEGLDHGGLDRALRTSADEGTPVTLIGASFGFVHLLDGLAEHGVRHYCADGSRTMDAGGFKGRSREVTREWLVEMVDERFEIPAHRCVNLLGMTELASQFYDGVLRDGPQSEAPRRKVNPHWTRTRVLDPAGLEPVELGERGVLWHLDLANMERPMVIQTDDLGHVDEDGWEVLGRASGTDARGCSLTVEELLRPTVVPLRRKKDHLA